MAPKSNGVNVVISFQVMWFCDKKTRKSVPRWKSSLIVNFMISIIVHLPLRGFPLRCYYSMNMIVNNFQDK